MTTTAGHQAPQTEHPPATEHAGATVELTGLRRRFGAPDGTSKGA